MGLFGKIRDMLTYEDDSEEVEPVKKEVSTVSIPAPLPEKEKIDSVELAKEVGISIMKALNKGVDENVES